MIWLVLARSVLLGNYRIALAVTTNVENGELAATSGSHIALQILVHRRGVSALSQLSPFLNPTMTENADLTTEVVW